MTTVYRMVYTKDILKTLLFFNSKKPVHSINNIDKNSVTIRRPNVIERVLKMEQQEFHQYGGGTLHFKLRIDLLEFHLHNGGKLCMLRT